MLKEYETLQTLPVGYTKGISNGKKDLKLIGNGWTVDVIDIFLFSFLKKIL